MKRILLAVVLAALPALAMAGTRRALTRPPQAPRNTTIENNATCDIGTSPAATLLLPYFEVDIAKHVSQARNTIFSIINTSRSPQVARVTVWSDQGYPALWFNLFLTGYDVESISLYDVLAHGAVPQTSSLAARGMKSAANSDNARIVSLESCGASGGPLDAQVLANVQSVLTSGVGAASGCRVGSAHDAATGFVTVDVVNGCSTISPLDMSYYSQVLLFDNVLTGDYERINPDVQTGNLAGGNPLVHLKAIPEGGGPSGNTPLPYTFYDRFTPPGARRIDRRQPLPASFAARFIQGGTGRFLTDYVLWREGASPGASSCVSANAAMPFEPAVRFDEDENPTTVASAVFSNTPVASAVATTSKMFPPLTGYSVTGWMVMDLDNRAGYAAAGNPFSVTRPSQNWVSVRLSAEGRYAVDYDATSLKNGCTNGSGYVTTIIKAGTEK